MKKAIIALLTTILAAFGYVAVDKTIEQRVSNLESQVSSQQEEISSLRGLENYYSKQETSVIQSVTETKPYNFTIVETTRKYGEQDPFYTEQNYTKQLSSNDTIQRIMLRYELSDSPAHHYYQLKEGDEASYTDVSLYITSVKTYIFAKEDITRVYYDSNMSVTSDYYYTRYRIVYDVTGYTDTSLAGYTLSFSNSPDSTAINEDGTFSLRFSSIEPFRHEPTSSEVPLPQVALVKQLPDPDRY